MMHARRNEGFTFIETLVVIAIIVVLSVIMVMVFANMRDSSSLRVSVQEVETAFREARSDTLASDGDTVYGVHIGAEEVVVFTGATYSPTSPSNITYTLVGGVTATTSLTASTTEIVFQRLTGMPNATGTITLESRTAGASSTLTVYSSGLID